MGSWKCNALFLEKRPKGQQDINLLTHILVKVANVAHPEAVGVRHFARVDDVACQPKFIKYGMH